MPNFCKVLVVSIPRTGTNHLFYTLRNIEKLNVRFELFNKEEAYSVSKEEVGLLAERHNTCWQNNRDHQFINWSAENPATLLEFLAEKVAINFDHLIFKLFPNQLSMNQIEAMFRNTSNLRIIFIHRRPIDSFISMMKSIQTRKYHNHDTSDLRVELCSRYFMEWWSGNYNWYRMVENLADGFSLPQTTLSYEADINVAEEELLQKVIEATRTIGLDLSRSAAGRYEGLEKQDKEARYDRKVQNWSTFEAELRTEHFYDRAFGSF